MDLLKSHTTVSNNGHWDVFIAKRIRNDAILDVSCWDERISNTRSSFPSREITPRNITLVSPVTIYIQQIQLRGNILRPCYSYYNILSVLTFAVDSTCEHGKDIQAIWCYLLYLHQSVITDTILPLDLKIRHYVDQSLITSDLIVWNTDKNLIPCQLPSKSTSGSANMICSLRQERSFYMFSLRRSNAFGNKLSLQYFQ